MQRSFSVCVNRNDRSSSGFPGSPSRYSSRSRQRWHHERGFDYVDDLSAPFWICALVTVTSSLVSFGYSVAAARASVDDSRINAFYALTRSSALLALCVIAIFSQSTTWVAAAAVSMIVVQGRDTLVGIVQRDRMKTVGPARVAVATTIALIVAVSVS